MRGLLYRDMKYIMHRTFLLLLYFTGMYLLLTVLFKLAGMDEVFKIYPVLVAMLGMIVFLIMQIIPGEIMKTEEKKEWKYYLISTGLGVEKIVAERYLMTFLINFAAYVYVYLMMIIFYQLADGSTAALLFPLVNGVYLMILGFNMMLQAFELPLGYRFGGAQADKMRIVLMLILLLPVAAYFLFGDIEWFAGENGFYYRYMEYLERPEALGKAAYSYMENVSRVLVFIFTLIPHLLVLCYYLSYKVSCKVYLKGVKDNGFREAA